MDLQAIAPTASWHGTTIYFWFMKKYFLIKLFGIFVIFCLICIYYLPAWSFPTIKNRSKVIQKRIGFILWLYEKCIFVCLLTLLFIYCFTESEFFTKDVTGYEWFAILYRKKRGLSASNWLIIFDNFKYFKDSMLKSTIRIHIRF